MALSVKLELRQGQSLVMTPQLQQAIKLLQLSNLDLNAFVEEELERNPLLERPESDAPGSDAPGIDTPGIDTPRIDTPGIDTEESAPVADMQSDSDDISKDGSTQELQAADEWLNTSQENGPPDPTGGLDTNLENVFPDSGDGGSGNTSPDPLFDPGWSSVASKSPGTGENVNLEAFVAGEVTLRDHLTEQLISVADPVQRLVSHHLIDMVDEAGYLRGSLENLADRLGAPLKLIEETLATVQDFDPPGVFARDLKECLALQLKDRNRYDPIIAALVENLHLLAAHDLSRLKRVCGTDSEDLADMISEIKALNPKPGLKFGTVAVQPVVPDVFVRQRSDGNWHVELNSETLPKVLVNQTYYSTVSKTTHSKKDKTYLIDCLQTANWLVKSLDQRARTILKVSEEIVRQQDGFLTHGVQHLRPLNLKTVADAISMHESTVSRVTSNKYMSTNRGIFELKYFFTSAIPSSGTGEAHSSEAVRYQIKQLIDNEPAENVLSDDKIVDRLRAEGVDIARRTVAKYREAMRIPSSVQRRREKKLALQTSDES
ncbi:RNA polymerase sigma-54 factor 2 [bacterium MnTg02]|nr:RNA polymerase sigma-54 factor 2 [bacterium MnTg02]